MTGVKQLPSGFWAVFVGGVWVDAACASKEAAEAVLARFLKEMKGGVRDHALFSQFS
jgi:hypothetical protein